MRWPYNGWYDHRPMRLTRHKLLSSVLLAAYASVMLVGEGLHSLIPGHDHRHGQSIVTHTAHEHSHGHAHHDHDCEHGSHGTCCHDHDYDQIPAGPSIVALEGDIHSHTCDICAFLYQAVSQPPQIATTPDLHPLVAELSCVTADFFSSAHLGLHAARGPPQLLA